MSKLIASSIFICSILMFVRAETFLSKGDELSVSNAGAAEQTDALRMTPYSRGIEKSGAGTYTLTRGTVDSKNSYEVRVREGRLAVTDAGTLPVEETPTDLLNLASFWLDANVNTTNYADTANIAAWYDCREVMDANGDFGSVYPSATTIASPKNGSEVVYTPTFPSLVTLEGMTLPMIYFGGLTTGTGMNFRKPDARSTGLGYDSIRHLFAVVCFKKSYGFVFGSNGNGQPILHPSSYGATTGLSSYYANADTYPNTVNGEFLVNGVRLNPLNEYVKSGLQLIELHSDIDRALSYLGTFFNDRSIAGRYGGDYIGEVLVYSTAKKALTAAERYRIQRYLMKKWCIVAPKGATSVQVAEGAEVEMSVASSATVSGHGTLVKTGDETATFRPVDANRMPGLSLSVEGGNVIADVRELNYAAKPGDTVVENHDKFMRRTLTVSNDPVAAREGKVTFVGGTDAAVRLGTLDSAISNVTADCTELILGTSGLAGGRLTVGAGSATIANASFESVFSNNDWVWVKKDGSSARLAVTTDSQAEDWRIAGADNDLVNFRKNYRHSNFYATDGSYALVMKVANVLYGHVTVTADGDYLFGFDGTGRYKYDNMRMTFSLVDADAKTNTFAQCVLPIGDGFRPYRFVVRGLKAGDYKLLIETHNGKATSSSNDSHALIDNLRLDLLAAGPSTEGVVEVPNGSFENTQFTSNTRVVTTFGTNQIESAGWTFTGSSATDVAPISRLMSSNYVAQDEPYGEWRVWFNGDAGRVTSAAFSIPAGRWQLRCKMAKWGFANNKWNGMISRNLTPSLGVRCLVNGEERFNAMQSVSSYKLTTTLFTNVLEVAATDRIVLELRQATAGNGTSTAAQLSVDDLEFVPVGTATEFIVNGSVDNDHPPWVLGGGTYRTDFSDTPNKDYGNYRFKGKGMLQFVKKSWAYQTIDFPAEGLYRLSFWARSRVSNYNNNLTASEFGGGRLLATLVDEDGKSTRIVETPRLLSTNFFETVALFKVPVKGRYNVRFEGIDEGDKTHFIDAVSVTAVKDAPPPAVSPDLALKLASGSRLRLDFDGELTVGKLKIGTRKYRGCFDASDPSGLFEGPGVLNVIDPESSTIIIFR